MAPDALSDVLKTVRLTGATFFDVVAKAPWVAESPPREMILPKILPGAEHLIAYHVLTEGRCFANIVGEEPIDIRCRRGKEKIYSAKVLLPHRAVVRTFGGRGIRVFGRICHLLRRK